MPVGRKYVVGGGLPAVIESCKVFATFCKPNCRTPLGRFSRWAARSLPEAGHTDRREVSNQKLSNGTLPVPMTPTLLKLPAAGSLSSELPRRPKKPDDRNAAFSWVRQLVVVHNFVTLGRPSRFHDHYDYLAASDKVLSFIRVLGALRVGLSLPPGARYPRSVEAEQI